MIRKEESGILLNGKEHHLTLLAAHLAFIDSLLLLKSPGTILRNHFSLFIVVVWILPLGEV
jgi:hypothetical protein